MSDREFLEWIRDRLVHVYGESPYVDFVQRLGKIAAQAQAGQPIAVVHGWFHGECVIRALDPEAVLPAGMALYSQPQAQAVNQQLLEAIKVCASFLSDFGLENSDAYQQALFAIAAAQQRHGAGE